MGLCCLIVCPIDNGIQKTARRLHATSSRPLTQYRDLVRFLRLRTVIETSFALMPRPLARWAKINKCEICQLLVFDKIEKFVVYLWGFHATSQLAISQSQRCHFAHGILGYPPAYGETSHKEFPPIFWRLTHNPVRKLIASSPGRGRAMW